MRLDPRQPEVRPADFGDRFKPGKYDVYLLGDIDRLGLRGAELTDLATAVERGAGLVMLGGYQSFGPGGYDATPLAPLLPVEMSRFDRQPPDEPIRRRGALARSAEDEPYGSRPLAFLADAGRQSHGEPGDLEPPAAAGGSQQAGQEKSPPWNWPPRATSRFCSRRLTVTGG